MNRAIPVGLLMTLLACSGGGSNTPTTPTPSPTPAPVAIFLSGTVSSSAGGTLSGALVTIGDGPNAGRSATTNGSGAYRIDNLTSANANVQAEANGFQTNARGVFINGTNTLSFTLAPNPLPRFTRTGTGDNVFDMPLSVQRVRIIGIFNGRGSNFIVKIGGRLIVNEIIGTGYSSTRYDGTLLTGGGGIVSITNSSGVSWSFEEIR